MLTNIFESNTGLLNLAPIKISGQYKIVIDQNFNFYLDDYNNKRILINKNQRFLPQLTNFLRTKSEIHDFNKLRYGGFSNKNTLTYHLPLYINQNEYPDYFVINNIGYGSQYNTNNITDETNIGNISTNINIVNLKEIGLHNIFEEIFNINNFEYPFYSNFEEQKITIFGFNFQNNSLSNKQFSLLNFSANQPYFGSVNNYILNLFKDNDIIFPRFINIEFEFTDNNSSNKLFGNYFGYFSKEHEIDNAYNFNKLKEKNKYGIFSHEVIDNEKLIQKQIWEFNKTKYKLNTFSINSYDTINTLPFARLKFNFIDENDKITIYNNNTIYYEYTVTTENLKTSFRETLISITQSINENSDFQINAYLDNKLQNTINFEIYSDLPDMYFKKPLKLNQYEFIDKFNIDSNGNLDFYQITDNDIIINNILDTQSNKIGDYLKFTGYNEYHKILDYFIYKENLICRLQPNNIVTFLRNKNLIVQIYTENYSKTFYHNPINFYNYINETIIESNYQYDKESYLTELDKQYDSVPFQNAFNSFKNYKVIDTWQFVDNNLESINYVKDSYLNANKKQVLNLKFNSSGNTAYITPNFFNFDLNFYNNNGNLIFEKVDLDDIRFHWFLIKSKTPEYLNDEKYFNAKLRYFVDLPKITSRLIDTGTNCETIFLGVKYYLPRKYKNYQFAVFLDLNDLTESDTIDTDLYDSNIYSFQVNNEQKTIYLRINKYLDFIDLLRDGNINNQPFIDLSFFYSVRQSYNTESDLIMTFKSGGLIMCDDIIPTLFNNEIVTDWKKLISTPTGNKWIVCLKRSNLVTTSSLKDLIPTSGEALFYVYSKINKIKYRSMIYKLKEIQYVSDDYVWCSDVEIMFFDNENLIINEYQNLEENKLYKLTSDPELLITNPDYILIDDTNFNASLSNNNLINQNTTVTFLTGEGNKVFKILNTLNKYTLKENYIETKKTAIYKTDGTKVETLTTFKFPECNINESVWNNMISADIDNVSENSKITIFDRNQLWYLIKTVMSTELKFKHNTEDQTIKIINELLLSNLYEFSNLNSIHIESDKEHKEYVKINVVSNDDNVVIWNLKGTHKLVKVNRYSGPYFPHFDTVKNISEFQVLYHEKNQIINVFDKRFGNIKSEEISSSFKNIKNTLVQNLENLKVKTVENIFIDNIKKLDINAIGLLDEVNGNIVSSLMIKTNDFNSRIINSTKNKYNYFELLKNSKKDNQEILVSENFLEIFSLNNLYPDKNINYISNFNKNISEYIYDTGIVWLLNNFYYLDNIMDNDNKKIKFDIIEDNIIIENYQPNGNYIFNFKRK